MNSDFTINFKKSCGNLHICLNGYFNGMCAWTLIKTIKNEYNGTGRVFVSTDGLKNLMVSGINLFKTNMTLTIMPLDRLFLKGKNGFKIGPNGCKVLICKKQNKQPVPKRILRSVCSNNT